MKDKFWGCALYEFLKNKYFNIYIYIHFETKNMTKLHLIT
jgi:hypothetical protein